MQLHLSQGNKGQWAQYYYICPTFTSLVTFLANSYRRGTLLNFLGIALATFTPGDQRLALPWCLVRVETAACLAQGKPSISIWIYRYRLAASRRTTGTYTHPSCIVEEQGMFHEAPVGHG
jgi:hypothetical protein